MTRIEHQSIDLGTLTLAYRVWGDADAPVVVLLHGLGVDGLDWLPVVDGLATAYRVIAVDLRGHGASSWPGDYGLVQMGDDVIAFLDQLRLTRVRIIGHSLGGAVAALMAARRPDLVGRLVLEEPPPLMAAEPPRGVPAGPDPDDLPLNFDWAVVAQITAQRNAPDPAWLPGLRLVVAPALLIGGGVNSHMPQDQLAEMATLMPLGRFVTVDAGHLIHEQRPAEFLAEVVPFLA